MKKTILTMGLPLAAGLIVLTLAQAGGPPVAIRGFDTVEYFTAGRAVRGMEAFTHTWNGAVWRFASARNRDRFAAEPQAFAPQYGAFCAWAVGHGYTAPVDPEAWKIVDGKLYLNYSRKVQREWEKDAAGWIAKADRNWPELQKKKKSTE
ncbi:MAG: YHS domain protein [Acidobacteria bacterium]|nr:YHS domain protein [Acidobacteriota bacterium]